MKLHKTDSFLGWSDWTIEIELSWRTAGTALTFVVTAVATWMAVEAVVSADYLLAAVLLLFIMLALVAFQLAKAIELLLVMSEFMQLAAQQQEAQARETWLRIEESKLEGIVT